MNKELLEEAQGIMMARGFHDELEKIAAGGDFMWDPGKKQMRQKVDIMRERTAPYMHKTQAISKVPAAPSVRTGLGKYVRHLAQKTKRQLGRARGLGGVIAAEGVRRILR